MMTRRANKWEADNWNALAGRPVADRILVENITTIPGMRNFEFGKIKGHNGDK
jgi:ribonuclease HI